jgi:hypothetical protein
MTRFAFFIGLCVSFPATAARADEDKAVAEAAKALQGTWDVREGQRDGQPGVNKFQNPGQSVPGWTFGKDGTYKVELRGIVTREGTWKVVAVRDKVVHLDMTVTRAQQTFLSILEVVDADTVRVCSAAYGAEQRPTKFEVTKGSQLRLYTLKRVQE